MDTRTIVIWGLGVGLAPAALGSDLPQDRRIESLEAEVAQLRASVAELSAARKDEESGWLTERRASEIRGLVEEVLADADTRASLLAQGATAGWDKGFYLASADGNYRLKISGQMDIRWVLNHQENAPSGDDNQYGFEMRRMKLAFEGHVIDPSWEYYIKAAFDRDGGAFELEDATVSKSFENGIEVTFGQFKLPFLREELTSSTRQLAVERSLVNEEFNQDRSKAVQVGYEADRWRVSGAYSDGFNSDNTEFDDSNVRYAFTGRGEFLVMGDWGQFKDFTSPRGSETGVMLGAAAHFQNGNGTGALASQDRFTWTLDGSAEFSGANLYAALIGNHLSDQGAVPDRDQWGFVVQGAYYVTEDWELFGRYEWGDQDTAGQEDLSIITIGVNYYIASHNLKWQTDFGYAFDAVTSAWSTSGTGWRNDAANEDGQTVLRTQFQLLF
jgi:hypothetical protein